MCGQMVFFWIHGHSFFQILIAWALGSVALLDNTIIILEMLQSFGDAATAGTLGFVFYLSRKKSYKRFTYGYGRKEDITGLRIVLKLI